MKLEIVYGVANTVEAAHEDAKAKFNMLQRPIVSVAQPIVTSVADQWYVILYVYYRVVNES